MIKKYNKENTKINDLSQKVDYLKFQKYQKRGDP